MCLYAGKTSYTATYEIDISLDKDDPSSNNYIGSYTVSNGTPTNVTLVAIINSNGYQVGLEYISNE